MKANLQLQYRNVLVMNCTVLLLTFTHGICRENWY